MLGDGKPRKSSEIIKELGLSGPSGWGALKRCWMNGNIMRSENPTFERKERFRGRRGLTRNTRSYYLYLINPKGRERLTFNGTKFTTFSAEYADKRGAKSKSKAQLVLNFLKGHSDSAF